MSIGSFTLIKNEAEWIAPCVLQVLPYIDEMVFFDGNSTDGTLEILKEIQKKEEGGYKVKVIENKDPINMEDDYVRLFNECLHTLSTDWAIFLHPDMFVVNPDRLLWMKEQNGIAMFTNLRSFGGEPLGQLYEIQGRGEKWKNVYRLKNPDLGAVYHGYYGASNEDVYHTEIVGNSRDFYGMQFHKYPYEVIDSQLHVLHFSDVRSYERRLGRMIKCLMNQGMPKEAAMARAPLHPRVSLIEEPGFKLIPTEYPPIFIEHKNKYGGLLAKA